MAIVRSAPIQIAFLTQDFKWRIAIERLRSPLAVWQAQSLSEWNELAALVRHDPNTLSVVEVTSPDIPNWLRRIGSLRRLSPAHRTVIVGGTELRGLAGIFIEAGAVACGFSVRDCLRLAELIERFERSCLPQTLDLRESIFGSLPWPTSAKHASTE